ncbi:non-homologous end-joining factor 1 isoform X4 [Pseudopipra pipra]|uniref:non-homologous end-joining factor 1 isoform X4 n=1 Tax=Pseudopipra pipra TaxID=415032 RepID=UPI003138B32C
MEVSEELESGLLTQPWASVHFGESAFLAKVCFRDTGYILLISDLSSVWYESADTKAVGQRSKELNKRLTVNVSSFLNHLCNLMCPLMAGQPAPTTTFSCNRSASGLILHVKSELSGLPFYWDFHCCPAPLEMRLPQIFGAGEGQAFASALQQLYTAVMQQEAKQAQKRQCSASLLPSSEASAACSQGQAKEGKGALQLKGFCHPSLVVSAPPSIRERECTAPMHPLPLLLHLLMNPVQGHGPLPRYLQLRRWNSFLQECL